MSKRESRRNRITVVMGNALKEHIEELAIHHERSVSDFIRLVLKEYCEALDEQSTPVEEVNDLEKKDEAT